jgi:hypothetical protein
MKKAILGSLLVLLGATASRADLRDFYPHSSIIQSVRIYNISGKEMAIMEVQDKSTSGWPTVKLAIDLGSTSGALMYATVVKKIGGTANVFWSTPGHPENFVDVYDYTIGTATVINVPIANEIYFNN